MTASGAVGWGAGPWGAMPWGGALSGALSVLGAQAVRENVVRLRLSRPAYWSGLFDVGDAAKPGAYSVAVVAGTVGIDGSPARPVSVVTAAPSTGDLPPGAAVGSYLDLVLDRPMTPYPAAYVVSASGLVSADLEVPLSAPAAVLFYGAFKALVVPDVSSPFPARDFANPQTLSALVSSLPNLSSGSPNSAALAVFSADDSGDYAFDSGLVALKKRIYRRLVTVPGGFAHLGDDYGVGVTKEGKKLALAATLGRLAARAESQISREPEVERVSVVARTNGTGLVRLQILVRTRAGASAKFFLDLPTK